MDFESIPRRHFLGAALCGAVAGPALLRVSPASAAYPERTIRIVNPNSPGGPSDIVARIMATELQQAVGGSAIVENKGGAGGNIGMGLVSPEASPTDIRCSSLRALILSILAYTTTCHTIPSRTS
jgi:tripartite-type tricarboxylate transporter receptor subunit TctC